MHDPFDAAEGVMHEAFHAVADGQAAFCRAAGAPFSARVLEAVDADVQAGGPFAALLAPWLGSDPQRLLDEAVWLRVLGGLHALALGAEAPGLAAVFPDVGGRPCGDAELLAQVSQAGRDHRDALANALASPPQTNEVRRAVALQLGFAEIARATGLPLATLEIGASAGLLLNWDAYAYAAEDGGWRRGPADASLVLSAAWSGEPPPDTTIRVVSRAACDAAPVRIADETALRRLRSYVWADQADRLARLDAAVAVALARGVEVDEADAADWLPPRLVPHTGVATVLYHSVMFQYVPAASRERILRTILAASAAARSDAPLAWLRLEPPPGPPTPTMELRLTLWPSGGERLLARVHPHGASVERIGAGRNGAESVHAG